MTENQQDLTKGRVGAKVMTSTDANRHLKEVLDHAVAGGDTVVTRHGQPSVASIPVEDYDHPRIQERLFVVRADRRAIAAYQTWLEDPENTSRPLEDVLRDLGLDEE